jgi:hypothetical protein
VLRRGHSPFEGLFRDLCRDSVDDVVSEINLNPVDELGGDLVPAVGVARRVGL